MTDQSQFKSREIEKIINKEKQFIEKLINDIVDLEISTKISYGLMETTVSLFHENLRLVAKSKGSNQINSLKNALIKLNKVLLKRYKRKNYKFKYLHNTVSS